MKGAGFLPPGRKGRGGISSLISTLLVVVAGIAFLSGGISPVFAQTKIPQPNFGHTPEAIEIHERGAWRHFDVASDEIFRIPARRDGEYPFASRTFPAAADPNAPSEPVPVLYERNAPRNPFTRRILTRRLLLQTTPDFEAAALKNVSGVASFRPFSTGPGFFIVEAERAIDVLPLTLALRRTVGVLAADPLLGQRYTKRLAPNDPLFAEQWYLTGTLRQQALFPVNIQVMNVWNQFRGRGIRIGIVDDGVQSTHPDLMSNYDPTWQFDYRDDDPLPNPESSEDCHGTHMAGLAAARGNNGAGVAGIAMEATLVGIRLIGGDVQTDEMNANSLLHSNVFIHVSNNSWGPADDGQTLEGPGPLTEQALAKAARDGRNGKGTIFVWPSGNGGESGDNANYDGFANSIRTIAVGAVDDAGLKAPFSEEGACLVVSAPGDSRHGFNSPRIVATDLTGDLGANRTGSSGELANPDYTQTIAGTSVSAAMISGVVALILEANPELGWRDVQEILMRSAAQNDPADSDWITNGAGFHFNHKYGAGLVHASAAVDLAIRWKNLGTQRALTQGKTNLSLAIPNNDPAGFELGFDFASAEPIRVEHALVTVSIRHPRRGDLAITLISPNGTKSRLAEKHSDPNADYVNWTFTSVFHWGELSPGQWRVQVADLATPNWGMLESVRVELLGTALPEATGAGVISTAKLMPLRLTSSGYEMLVRAEEAMRCQIQVSPNLIEWTLLMETNLTSNSSVRIFDPEASNAAQRFYRAVVQR